MDTKHLVKLAVYINRQWISTRQISINQIEGAGALFWAVLSFCQFRNKTLSQKMCDHTVGWIGKVTLGVKNTKKQRAVLGYRIWSPDEVDDSNKKYKLSSQDHMIFEIGELECPLTLNQICLLYYLVSEYDTINWNSPTIKIDQDHLQVYHEHMTSQGKRILEMIQKKIPDTIQMKVDQNKPKATTTTQTHLVSNYVDDSTPPKDTTRPKQEISLDSLKGRNVDSGKPKISLNDLQEDQKLQRRMSTKTTQPPHPPTSTPRAEETEKLSDRDSINTPTSRSSESSTISHQNTHESESIDYGEGEGEDDNSSIHTNNTNIDSSIETSEDFSTENSCEMSSNESRSDDHNDTSEMSSSNESRSDDHNYTSSEISNSNESQSEDKNDTSSSDSEEIVPRRPIPKVVSVSKKKSHPYIDLSDDSEVIPKKPVSSSRQPVKKKNENIYKSNTKIMSKKPSPKRVNPWQEHISRFRESHPDIPYREALKQAKLTYKKS